MEEASCRCLILGTNNNIGSISVITHYMFGSTKLYKGPMLGQEAATEEKATAVFLQNSPQEKPQPP